MFQSENKCKVYIPILGIFFIEEDIFNLIWVWTNVLYFNCLTNIVKNSKTDSTVQSHGVLKRKAAKQFLLTSKCFINANSQFTGQTVLQPFPSASIFLRFNFKASVVVKIYIHKIYRTHKIYRVMCHFYKVFGP